MEATERGGSQRINEPLWNKAGITQDGENWLKAVHQGLIHCLSECGMWSGKGNNFKWLLTIMTWKTIGSISLCLIRLEEKQKIIIGKVKDRGEKFIYRRFPALFTHAHISFIYCSSATMIPICYPSGTGKGDEMVRWSEKRKRETKSWNLRKSQKDWFEF